MEEKALGNKVRRYGRVAGRKTVEKALQLFYALRAPETPKWAKRIIIGALAYFILPIDAIPDLLPGVGYTDDLGTLAAALLAVQFYITDAIKDRARQKADSWLGEPEPAQPARG